MKTLEQSFSFVVKKYPELNALVYKNKTYTYKELDAISDKLSSVLFYDYGLRKGDHVLFCFERSDEAIISLLSIIKLGCKFIPIVPEFGRTRIEYIINLTTPKILLSNLNVEISEGLAHVTFKDLLEAKNNNIQKVNKRDNYISNKDLCILFTSGSTGRPKGVILNEKPLLNRIKWLLSEKPILQGEYLFQNTKFTTVDSLWEIFSPLISGNTLLILPDKTVNSPQLLVKELARYPVSRICLVPSLLDALLDVYPDLQLQLPKLKQWVCSGEILSKKICIKFYKACPNGTLYNQYGLTESTSDVSSFDTSIYFKSGIPNKKFNEISAIPIGKPISNVGFSINYIEDTEVHGQKCGELCIYGDCLSSGYFSNPLLNKEKYGSIQIDINESLISKRALFTGDLVYKDKHGCFTLVNRKDDLLNIRGYKVYPQEVESTVLNLKFIDKCKLMKHPNSDQLALYYIVEKTNRLPKRELLYRLEAFCLDNLPAFMQPHFFIAIKKFDKTVTGKIDPLKLPEPKLCHLKGFGIRLLKKPTNTVEELLRNIWSKLLNIGEGEISVTDDFFLLGGHSLLATKLAVQINRSFSVKISLQEIFEFKILQDMAKHISSLPAQRVELIPERKSGEKIPLSYAQERLYFIDQLSNKKELYNIPIVFELEGQVDSNTLKKALQLLVERHEILRTELNLSEPENFEQIVHPIERLSFDFLIIEQFSNSYSEEITSFIKNESLKPIALSICPLWRAGLIKTGDKSSYFYMIIHHLIADGWSLAVFTQELSTIYNHLTGNIEHFLEPLKIQYADYALWQRSLLEENKFENQLSYWSKKLSDAPTSISILTDYKRPKIMNYHGSQYYFEIDSHIHFCLKKITTSQNVSLYMLLLASLYVLLYRFSGQETIILGSAIANRRQEALEGLIGYFANTLPLKADILGSEKFIDFLAKVKKITLEADKNQDIPFEKIIESLSIPRALNKHPLFQIMFILQNTESTSLELNNIKSKLINIPLPLAKFDLMFEATEKRNGGIQFQIEYSTELFEKKTIETISNCFLSILESISNHLDQTIDSIPLLGSKDINLVLGSWNETKKINKFTLLSKTIETQSSETPHQIAIKFLEEELTYSELNKKANILANYLVKLGVNSESIVAICVERGIDLVVCLLGVLKSGAAYVPLDTRYPQDRLQCILDDTNAKMLLTQTHLTDLFKNFKGSILDVSKDYDNSCDMNPIGSSSPNDLAYILYTSGSTGKPKGVMIEQKGLINLLESINNRVGIRNNDIILAITSIGFDISALELFAPLIIGGTVVIANNEASKDPQLLTELIEKEKITVLQATPATWNMLLEENWRPKKELKMLIGGEPCPTRTAELLTSNGSQLWNVYGPTETTIWSTLGLVKDPSQITIGKPIGNTEIYILDKNLKPCPIGVKGDLYIGGQGLARGYFNRSDLTKKAFLPHPFQKESGDRIYKTGDLAYYLHNGEIVCLGRSDYQVKIRGYRVELGEIEAILSQQEGIKEAVIIVHKNNSLDELVGYIVPSVPFNDFNISSEKLVNEISKFLPEYMVPKKFVRLKKFPLTSSGKVDRKSLPRPEKHIQTFDCPSDKLDVHETKLALIWKNLLTLKSRPIGFNDNFFKLGGHSLLATRLRSQIEKQFGCSLQLKDIFDTPTLKGLAEKIKVTQTKVPCQVEKLIRPKNIPLSFAQQRLWFINELLPAKEIYNIPIAFELEGEVSLLALQQSLSDLAKRHEILRTQLKESSLGGMEQFICNPEELKIELLSIDISSEDEQDQSIRNLIKNKSLKPFNLHKDILWKTWHIKQSDKKSILFTLFHHIISDGWSLAIFTEELSQLYNYYAYSKDHQLKDLPIQYADFTIWQRQLLETATVNKQKAYWRENLKGASLELPLVTDKIRPQVLNYNGEIYSFSIPSNKCSALKVLAQKHQASLNMMLQTALIFILHRYTNQKTIIIGSSIANRHRESFEGVIGLFANTLPIRVDIEDTDTFCDLLNKTREASLRADENQDIPFEKIVESLQVPRSLNKHPLFQVMFIMQNTEPASLEIDNVKTTPIQIDLPRSKLDLTLETVEVPNGNLEFKIEFSVELFERTTIKRFSRHFLNSLDLLVNNPSQRLAHASFLDQAEKNQILKVWNQTEKVWEETNLCDSFEQVCLEKPNKVALKFSGKKYTYEEINKRANSIANFLIEQGIQKDSLVGVCLNRNPKLVVALLGILKSGGAYVPLDPNYPKNRLEYIVEDTKLEYLITEDDCLGLFKNFKGSVLNLNSEEVWCSKVNNPKRNYYPNKLAYILYTSGSTGKPKGVMIEEKGLTNLLRSLIKKINISEKDSLLAVTSIGFDIAALEIFSPLMVGGTLCLADYESAKDSTKLSTLLLKEDITLFQATPATWNMLLNSGWKPRNNLRMLIGGEPCPQNTADKLIKRESKLWNVYGPTETTIWSTISLLSKESPITIGRPIDNTEIYILNNDLQLCPIGVKGDLYIGGKGLARGYYNQPDLTKKSFIQNPFFHNSKKMIYKTGDLAYYLPDGQIICCGRSDYQVKIRGYRIELGEIEAVLRTLHAIKEAVVIAKKEKGTEMLIAYIVPVGLKNQDDQITKAIRKQLSKLLPEYMLPSIFVMLEELPLNSNGKVDRNALPTTDQAINNDRTIPARNILEKDLVEIWCSFLNKDSSEISIEHNFFHLGGNSLILLQVLNRINKITSSNLSAIDLYNHPTIKEIAAYITSKAFSIKDNILLPITKIESEKKLFLIHAGATTVLPYLHFSKIKNWSIFGINNPHFGNANKFSTIEEMAQCYCEQILSVQKNGPYRIGGWSLGGTVAIEIANLLSSKGYKVEFVLLLDTVNWVGIPKFTRNYPEFAKKVGDGGDLDAEAISLMATELEKSENLLKKYIPKPFKGRTILLKAEEIDHEDDAKLKKWLKKIALDPYNNWEAVLSNIETYSVPGSHSLLFRNNSVDRLVNVVDSILNRFDFSSERFKKLSSQEKNIVRAVIFNNEFLLNLYIKNNPSINLSKLFSKVRSYSKECHLKNSNFDWVNEYILSNKPL